MPSFVPFPALRFAPGTDLAAVIAPPYDVLSEADVDALAARDAHNIVHLDVPRGERRYEAARAGLDAWLAEGVLVRDDRDSFTIYRMFFTDAAGQQLSRIFIRRIDKRNRTVLVVIDDGVSKQVFHKLL